jgi:hypothetical protein
LPAAVVEACDAIEPDEEMHLHLRMLLQQSSETDTGRPRRARGWGAGWGAGWEPGCSKQVNCSPAACEGAGRGRCTRGASDGLRCNRCADLHCCRVVATHEASSRMRLKPDILVCETPPSTRLLHKDSRMQHESTIRRNNTQQCQHTSQRVQTSFCVPNCFEPHTMFKHRANRCGHRNGGP